MQSTFSVFGLIASLSGSVAAAAASYGVSGTCEGFASGVTGGGDATPVIATDIDHLKELLTSADPQVIVLDKTYNFLGSEGTTTETGCAPYGTGDMCQEAIDATGSWCSSDYPSIQVTYDTAASEGIQVASNKTLIGVDDKGVMLGKGLRFTNGVSNIIVQNIMISDLNPQYVWGGDALTFSGADTIWIDHVTTQYLGRQHYVFGEDASQHITLSNNFINGYTNYSAGCNSYHYWTIELVGVDDQITFQNNYVYHTSGRSPALSGSTLFHAVNSVWEDNDGHAIEGDSNGQGLFEGCVFKNVSTVVVDGFGGHLFSSPDADLGSCASSLGRACEANILTDSGAFDETDTSFFSNFTGLSIASAVSAAEAESSVPGNVGHGKLSTSSSAASSSSSSSSSSSTSSSTKVQSSSRPQASASIAANRVGSNGPLGASAAPVASPTSSSAAHHSLPPYPRPSGSGFSNSPSTGSVTKSALGSSSGSSSSSTEKSANCKRDKHLRRAMMTEGNL